MHSASALRRFTPVLGAVAGALALAVPADAAPTALPTVSRTLTADAVVRDCSGPSAERRAGVDTLRWTAPATGFVTFRGKADGGDWDLMTYGAESGRRLFGSLGFGSEEVVQTWVGAGESIVLKACHRRGADDTLDVAVDFVETEVPKAAGTPQLVRVEVPSQSAHERLVDLGVDVTHNVHDGHADVIVSGADELAKVKAAGFRVETKVADLVSHYRTARKADARYAERVGRNGAPTPSGRTTYRAYEDYGKELKALAERFPGHVKPFAFPRKSFQGRVVQGVEIASDVAGQDGRPVYLVVALHHAREWPSAEAAMEFATMMAEGFGSDPKITDLLQRERVVVVPLINPDGFISSRAAEPYDPANTLLWNGVNPQGIPVFGDLQTAEGVAPPGGILTYRRKNCNGAINNPRVPCELQYGVDPNRNYGQFWGGTGSSGDPMSQSYRGPGPWSETETQNVHEFSQNHPVTALMTIHNVAALVLRPPGTSHGGLAPDESAMKAIGDAMGAATGYTSQYSFQLYDTSGTTEDWNYAAAGTYGYTIEMGPRNGEFHLPYEEGVVEEWNGRGELAGRGLREALLTLAQAAADPAHHSVLTGTAPAGTHLRLRKEFSTMTSPTCDLRAQGSPFTIGTPCQGRQLPAQSIGDNLDYELKVPSSGTFEWHVTPSTRPFVKKNGGREQWTLTCERTEFDEDGDEYQRVLSTRFVSVERGERVDVGAACTA